MSCFFRYRCLHGRFGRSRFSLSFNQVSHIGYCNYFHMSRANKLHELRRERSYFPKRSDKSKYWFFRCSDWSKTKKKWKKHLGGWDTILKEVKKDGAFKS